MSLKTLPLLSRLARPTQLTTAIIPRTRIPTPSITRWNSTQSAQRQEPTPPNPHRNFYKAFGRPVAKVFLMAIFTYQFIYWLWVKLDMDEIVREKEGEVKVLEGKLEEVLKKKKGE